MTPVLRPGDLLALALREGAAPSRCLTGEILAVDEHGLRIALRHWAIEAEPGPDFFVPWSSITAALVADEDDDWEEFLEAAAAFQERCREML